MKMKGQGLKYNLYAGHAPQAEPNNGRLEVDLEGVSLQLDTFRPEGSPYAWRLAFSIHQLEVCCIFFFTLQNVKPT